MNSDAKSPSGLAYDTIDLVAPWRRGREPIVFHHGIGTNRHVWTEWLPPVLDSHRVVRFDTRGFGQSAVPPDDHRWTLEGALADLMEMVTVAGGQKAHLVGESFGGTVCLMAAGRYPDRVATVTVSNTAFKGSGIAHVGGWRADFERRGAEAWSRDMMDKRFVDGALDNEKWSWFHSVQAQSRPHVTAGLGELLAGTDLTAELARIKAPLLILMPDRSPFVTARMGVELAEHVPHAELQVMPGSRHGLPFSHGAACGAALASHIAKHARRPVTARD